VRVLGAVTGAAEADFFAGIRLLLLPYRRKVMRGTTMTPASGAFVEAAAFGTPALALASAGLRSLEGSGCETAMDIRELAQRVEKVIEDDGELERLAGELTEFRQRQTLARTVDPIVSQWRRA
jgi:glycosyltransferase involved in cell wall biosynthesis